MEFYKLTNKEEIHHGFQYKDGLNADTVPFNPSGSCSPGGLYYASKDILAFLDSDMYWIREVTIPEDAQTYKDPSTPEKYKADKIILGKRKNITFPLIKKLIEDGADIHAVNDDALRWASFNGNLPVVKFLVSKGSNIHADDSSALYWASRNGHLSIVKFLVSKGVDTNADDSFALRRSSANGHLPVVQFLVSKGADIHAKNDIALRLASQNRHTDVVEFLKNCK